MAALSTIAAVTGAVAGLAGTGYSIYSSEKAKSAAKDAAAAQKVQADKAQADMNARQESENRASAERGRLGQVRQSAAMSGAGDGATPASTSPSDSLGGVNLSAPRSSTLLTSPLATSTGYTAGRKTVLGS